MSRRKGIKKFEFFVSVAVIGVVAAVLLVKLQEAQELAERVVVETTVRNVQSGLRLARAEALMRGEEYRVAKEMSGSNPVRWLTRQPEGYLGESDGRPAGAPDGAWYFDRRSRELAYRPKLRRHLRVEGGGELRWRIVPAEQGAEWDPMSGGVAPGITPTTPYHWF